MAKLAGEPIGLKFCQCFFTALAYFANVSRYHSYIASARLIIDKYNGSEPFAAFLKIFFSSHKKYGSRYRKHIAHLCYCFFRLGKAAPPPPKGGISEELLRPEEKILMGLFLCSADPNKMLSTLNPDWNEKVHLPVGEKLLTINSSLLTTDAFPWRNELSDGVDHERFCESFFTQPDLFIRIRPGHEKTVLEKFEVEGLTFNVLGERCLQIPNSTKIEQLIKIDEEAVIQDLSSQRTGEIIKSEIRNLPASPSPKFPRSKAGRQVQKSEISLWDCCAGSGGKSIMLFDIFPEISLTVSDVRESILHNLKKRFLKAGISNYKSFTIDLTQPESEIVSRWLSGRKSEIIIADVPCTGSGTWSRTPEQLYFFDEKKIAEYASLQRKIISNVIPHLQPGGYFVYITCSVFRKENEEMIDFIKEKFGLQLKRSELLRGYDKKADSMFIAIFNA